MGWTSNYMLIRIETELETAGANASLGTWLSGRKMRES